MKRLIFAIWGVTYITAAVAFAQTNGAANPPADSDYLTQLEHIFESISGLPHLLVGLSCIMLGYVLRCIRRFPNDALPLICMLWGMLLNPLVADVRATGDSLRLWLVKNILMGLIVGAGAWLFHKFILKRFEDKIPLLGGLLADADKASAELQQAKHAPSTDDKA